MERPPASIANFLAELTSLARGASIGRGLFLALPYLASPAGIVSACCVVVGIVAAAFVESEGSCATFFAASSSDEMLCLLTLLLFVDMDIRVTSPSSPSNMESVCQYLPSATHHFSLSGCYVFSLSDLQHLYPIVLIWPSKLRLVDFTTTRECRRGRITVYFL